MNKTDRLLAIVLELQRKGRQRAEDLAETFETSVRTIYRDVQALSEAGVPVVGAPGQGYWLMDGYFLPPVSFTAGEAVSLLIGSDFVEQQFDAEFRDSAAAARGKIEAVLPEPVQRESEQIRAGVRLITPKRRRLNDTNAANFALLRQAIREQRSLTMVYCKPGAPGPGTAEQADSTVNNSPKAREIDPYGLVFVSGNWMLVAYCHLRHGLRHFLLSRIRTLQLLDQTFDIPHNFRLEAYIPKDDRQMHVKIWFDYALSAKVKEQQYFYMEQYEEQADGVLVTLRVRQLEEVQHWVLGWGSGAVVLEPDSLRQYVQAEAKKMLKRY
ncbi:helix-turn-helix transcriptional regulator [Paenibacillus sp. HW567]|uniref:helix-turn-helix transcriptional regulator n=1 Tax=Paenibacillus sp. HW567 TaxID=1034769 RepID=UPI000379C58D|nr:YafY family protein [Paenibacillus sp. HW567]